VAFIRGGYRFKKSLRKQMLAYIFASKYLHIMETRRDVFQAIADPTRREIISMVARQPLNVNAIAEKFDVSRQAVSLHVKILMECGLITIKQQGRERYCEAKLKKLSEVSDWIDQYRKFWTTQFNSLDKYLTKVQSNKKLRK
jgi:DNA-binding transcriptional ArsR family regulator